MSLLHRFVTAKLVGGQNGEPRQGVCVEEGGSLLVVKGESGAMYTCHSEDAVAVPLSDLWGSTLEFARNMGVTQ